MNFDWNLKQQTVITYIDGIHYEASLLRHQMDLNIRCPLPDEDPEDGDCSWTVEMTVYSRDKETNQEFAETLVKQLHPIFLQSLKT